MTKDWMCCITLHRVSGIVRVGGGGREGGMMGSDRRVN